MMNIIFMQKYLVISRIILWGKKKNRKTYKSIEDAEKREWVHQREFIKVSQEDGRSLRNRGRPLLRWLDHLHQRELSIHQKYPERWGETKARWGRSERGLSKETKTYKILSGRTQGIYYSTNATGNSGTLWVEATGLWVTPNQGRIETGLLQVCGEEEGESGDGGGDEGEGVED